MKVPIKSEKDLEKKAEKREEDPEEKKKAEIVPMIEKEIAKEAVTIKWIPNKFN